MPFLPFRAPGMWLRGLLSLALPGAGAGPLYARHTHRHAHVAELVPAPNRPNCIDREGDPEPRVVVRRVDWQFGFNRETAYLPGDLVLAAWCLGGRWLSPTLLLRRRDANEPTNSPDGEVLRTLRSDGTEFHVEVSGPGDGPPVVLTHGWGLDGEVWRYAKQELAQRRRLIVWARPGPGRSWPPAGQD